MDEEKDMPTKRAHLSASAVNGQIYAIGGKVLGGRILSTVEAYDTGFIPTTVVEPSKKLAVTWGDIKNDR